MQEGKNIRVGIGFATGRKSFKKVLKTYIYNWKEYHPEDAKKVEINLLVAYDLKYSNTKSTDYTSLSPTLLQYIDNTFFIGSEFINREVKFLINNNIINQKEAKWFFGSGYAAKRNSVLYTAIKNDIDYLLFLDDDEYPMAVTKTHDTAIWSGQHVLQTHLNFIKNADITNGYHCGYISPIPFIEFNSTLTETDFRIFIEAISNDIVTWDSVKNVINNGGVTYADTGVLVENTAKDVQEVNHSKFISGANLCINLTDPQRVNAFYNPPGARGEDTFLSTCLSDKKVIRVPCYTFHDGFSTYRHLLDGVLPINLKYITADTDKIINRFYRACIGWVRYKPLLLYITKRDSYEKDITEMRNMLESVLPKVCAYFNKKDFMKILNELDYYSKNVKKHYIEFLETQRIWSKICEFLSSDKTDSKPA